jgi:hypothetical protein
LVILMSQCGETKFDECPIHSPNLLKIIKTSSLSLSLSLSLLMFSLSCITHNLHF